MSNGAFSNLTAENVKMKQEELKMRYGLRWRVKPSIFKVGDVVRIREIGVVTKGGSKFGNVIRVVTFNKNSVVTQDGRVWNVRKVVKCRNYAKLMEVGNESVDHFIYVDGPVEKTSVASRVRMNNRSIILPNKFKV